MHRSVYILLLRQPKCRNNTTTKNRIDKNNVEYMSLIYKQIITGKLHMC